MPLWQILLMVGAPLISQLIGGLFRPRRPGGPAGRPPTEPTQRVIPLPQPPITEQDIRQTIFLTRDLFDQMRSGQASRADITSGVLREAQKIAEESAAVRGYSSGMAQRAIDEAVLSLAPQLTTAQQAVQAQNLASVLQELTTMAALGGRVGSVLTPDTLRFLQGLSAGEAAITGFYNPPFNYGLFSPTDLARFQQGQAFANNIMNMLQWLLLFLRPGGGGPRIAA